MIVLDTHAVIWWFESDSRLSLAARAAISQDPLRLIPAISLWEIALLAVKGRITLSAGVQEFLGTALMLPRTEVAPITPGIAVRASRFGPLFPQDPADRLIAATAIELDAPLVTRDERMQELATLRTVW